MKMILLCILKEKRFMDMMTMSIETSIKSYARARHVCVRNVLKYVNYFCISNIVRIFAFEMVNECINLKFCNMLNDNFIHNHDIRDLSLQNREKETIYASFSKPVVSSDSFQSKNRVHTKFFYVRSSNLWKDF